MLAFKTLGLHLIHKTMPKYLAAVASQPEEHPSFTRSLVAYVDQCNEHPEGTRRLNARPCERVA
eukprot:787152-Lingulodinium_polyedra.AAC.1